MRIFTKGNRLDFEAPVYMSEPVLDKFVIGMKQIFGNEVHISNIPENKKEMKAGEKHPKKFDMSSILVLTNPELDNEEAGSKLGKSEFAVLMKRGPLLKEFMEWLRKRGKEEFSEEDVNEFFGREKNGN